MSSLASPSTVQSRSGPGVHLPCLDCRQGRFFHELEIEGELTYTCPQCGHQLTGDEIRGYLHPVGLHSAAWVLENSLPARKPRRSVRERDLVASIRGQTRTAEGRWRLVAMLENPGLGRAHENVSYRADLVDAKGQPLASESGRCGLVLPGQRVPIIIERRAAGPIHARVSVYAGGVGYAGALPLITATVLGARGGATRVRVVNPYLVELCDLKVTAVRHEPGGVLNATSLGGVSLSSSGPTEVDISIEGATEPANSEAFVTFTPLTLRRLVAG